MKITKEQLKQIINEEIHFVTEGRYGVSPEKAERMLRSVMNSPDGQYVRLMPDDIAAVLRVGEYGADGSAKVFAYPYTDSPYATKESEKLGEVDVKKAYLPKNIGEKHNKPTVRVPRMAEIARGLNE